MTRLIYSLRIAVLVILAFYIAPTEVAHAQLVQAPYQNADRYTVFTPSLDTQIIYVSDSEGSDLNDGLSSSTPVATIAHGKTLLRPGYPDWLLLKKGDTWEEALGSLSNETAVVGRSADEPALISSYGTGARPILEFNGISGFIVLGTDTLANYVAIVGLEFYNAEKDPLSPTYDPETDKADVSILSDVDWFLVEDNVFRFLEAVFFPYTGGDVANLSLRKNIFRDVYSTNSFASCLFTAGTLNLLVEDNIFDNCGWAEGVSGAEASGFNRAAYLCCGDGQTVYRGNIDYNGSSGGVQLRTGGTIEDSLFLQSPIAITIGSSQNSTTSTVPGLIRNNVILDARDIGTEQRGFGIWLTSSEVGEENGGGPSYLENVEVYNNIISSNVNGTGNVVGITVGGDGAILGLDVYDNVIYDWREPDLSNNFASALNFNNTSTSSVDIVINDNYFQQPRGGYLVVMNNYDPSRITLSGNTYWSDSAEGSQYANAWFELNGGNMNYTDWVSNTGEVGSTRELTEFVDPDRSIATYMTSLGIGGGIDEFMNRARQQSADTYDERFTSYAVNEYVRAGFVLAGAEPTPDPVITFEASSSSITEGSTTTLTWSTTDATSCTASNGWSGARATADSLVVSPTNTTTYTLTCVGDGGSDVASVVVTVTAAPDPVELSPEVEVEYVDASGVRTLTSVVDGVTTISGVAPFLVKFDASGTRAPTAFAAQSTITDPEAYAFLMVGYRINYGENRGGTWAYPAGAGFSRDEDTGSPIFSYVYTTAGSHTVQLKTRDELGNEEVVNFTINVSSPSTTTLIPVSDGAWPTFVSGERYMLEAGGDYSSFGTLETGGLHNIVFEKTGSGADPIISVFSPDGRSKFDSTQMTEFRAAHIRLVNIDIGIFSEGQRGFDYVGVIGGVIRRHIGGPQSFFWHEGTDIIRSNVRFARGFFLQDTEVRSTSAESGYVLIGTFHGLHARNTRFVHAENGPTTYAMLRVYGSHFTFRNNLWYLEVDGGTSNGTLTSLLAIDGVVETVWRDDDTVGPIDSTENSDRYGYISDKSVLQHNQLYAQDSYLTNGLASVGGGNPSGSQLVRPRLIGWEDNYFFPAGNIGQTIQNGEIYGQYGFWRNNRKDMGAGDYVTASTGAPNQSVGDSTTYNGPELVEDANTRPIPTSFSSTPDPVITFEASSSSITEGSTTTLTWSTTDATSCTASNGWSGARATADSLVVSPTNTTTYTLTCVGDGGSDVASVVVTVTAAPDPGPDPDPEVDTPPSSGGGGGGGGGGGSRGSSRDSGLTFKLNEQVTLVSSQVVKDLSRREDLGTQAAGSAGKVISKLVRVRNGVSYVEVAFTNGLTGWVDRSSLSKNQLGTLSIPGTVAVAPTSGQVRAVTALNIRVTPNGRIIGTEEAGSVGTIESAIKPEVKDGHTWVYVQFGAVGGFVAQEFLAAVVPPSAERDALLIAQIQLLIAEVQRLMLLLAAMKGI